MRRPLLAALLLVGCLAAPDAPPAATPEGAASSHEERQGAWTLEVMPAALAGSYGDPVPFELRVAGPGAHEARVRMAAPWARVGVTDRGTEDVVRIEGIAFLGRDERLGVELHPADADAPVRFAGPPMIARHAADEVRTARTTHVTDDAPGLSWELVDGGIRVVYAAPANATTTADETVRAVGDFTLVDAPGGRALVGFIERAQSDAVAPLDAPQRSRVVAEATGLAPGELRLVVVTRLVCFCLELPPPRSMEASVTIR